jgi:hypothetical protein
MSEETRRDFALGRPPETAEEWAEEIMAVVPGLSTAAPLNVSEPIRRQITELVRLIQRQSQEG